MSRLTLCVVLGCLLLPISLVGAEEAVRVSPPGSRPLAMNSRAVNVNGRSLFALTSDPLQRASLYSSDGTPEGTQLLIPDGVLLGADGGGRFSVAVVDGFAYFGGPGGALWRTDGTPEGTAVSVSNQGWSSIPMVAIANGRIWFVAAGAWPNFWHVWVSDGTAGGTHFVSDVGMSPLNLFAIGDQALYTSFTPQVGFRLMRSDGTEAGTYALAVDGTGAMGYDAYAPHQIGGLVYFSGSAPGSGTEPWVTDGTPRGTRMIAELAPAAAGSDPFGFRSVLGKVLFATDAFPKLWTTDGTPSGTYPIVTLPGTPSYVHSVGSLLYFEGTGDQGWSLWRSDGSSKGTFALVENLGQGILPYMSGDAGGRLAFSACDSTSGCEPWITDGTVEGTRLLADVVPGPQSSNPRQFVFSGGFVFFAAAEGEWAVALPAARTPDFDLNGYADLCWQGADDSLSIWLMRGVEAVETPVVQPETPPAAASLAGCGDLTGDGAADLIFRDVAGGALEVWRMQGSHRQDTHPLPYRADPSRVLVGAADLDADGHNDLLWHAPTTGALSAWLMNGLERRSVEPLVPSGISDVQWRPAGVGDFDADGKTDILWRHKASGKLVAWLMDGLDRRTGVFLTPSQAVSLDWRVQSVIDLDSDGDADIVWRHHTSGRLVAWLMDQTVRVDGRVLSPSFAP